MPSISQAGRETEHIVLPDDAKHVPVEDAQKFGYWGVTPDTTDRDEYTFAGAAKRLKASQSSSRSGSSSTSSTSGSSSTSSSSSDSGTSARSGSTKTSKG